MPNVVHGTNASEVINAADGVTNLTDLIYGYGGNDSIFGLGGNRAEFNIGAFAVLIFFIKLGVIGACRSCQTRSL